MTAKQSREGWFQSGILARFLFGTTPALRATLSNSVVKQLLADLAAQEIQQGFALVRIEFAISVSVEKAEDQSECLAL